MITLICGTNHAGSNTSRVAQKYLQVLSAKGAQVKYLNLEMLPENFAFAELYGNRTERFQQLLTEFLVGSKKFIIISPEYNGSYPGVLKTFIDASKPDMWRGKKAALVGVSDGRAGNLRGMDHLSDVLHHMGVVLMPHKLPISKVETLLTSKEVTDEATIKLIEKQMENFLEF